MSQYPLPPSRPDPTLDKVTEPFVGQVTPPEVAIPVRVDGVVVTQLSPLPRFRTGALTISNGVESVVLAGAEPKRQSLVVVNSSPAITVWILANRGDSTGNGFPLGPGASMAMGHQAEVFVLAPTATAAAPATLNYAAEVLA